MQKLVSFFFLFLVYTAVLYGQAAVNIPITVSDNNGGSKVLYFGLDLTATAGIDPTLGESDLPPFPPTGVYEARFDLTPYAGSNLSSYRDYRNAPLFPWSGNVQHRLIWQLTSGATTLTIAYNLPGTATMQIQDEFGGVLVNSPILSGTGNFLIAVPITAVKLNIAYSNVPVELTSFTGLQNGNAVVLNWTTATELNNKGFEIERKMGGSEWENIAFINGHGTTTEFQNYSYTDEFKFTDFSGKVHYRLHQIDFDGKSSYSDPVEVFVDFSPKNYVLLQNYPNPFNPSTTIKYALPFTSNVKVVVYNMIGEAVAQLIDNVQDAGYHNLVWNADGFSSGLYFYSFEAKAIDGSLSHNSVMKMMLVK